MSKKGVVYKVYETNKSAMTSSVQAKIDKFFSNYQALKVPKSTVLIYPSEGSDTIYKLDSGRVVQYDISKDGTKIVVNVFKAPAFFPMSSVFSNMDDNYFFETHSECVIRKALKGEVLAFVKSAPDVLHDLLGRVFIGIGGIQRRIVYATKGSALQRLTFELLLSISRFGEKQEDKSYTIPFSESDLAINSGLTRETVNREIAKMKKQGLIKISSNKLYITSRSKLEQYLKG